MADDNLKQEIEDAWLQVKEATTSIFKREITHQEFYYLASCYPYLEICNADYPFIDQGTEPKVIENSNGWRIFDFGSVLVSSASELQQRQRYPRPGAILPYGVLDDEEDGDEGGGGYGTIVNQYAAIAEHIITLAMQKDWPGAEIISGYYPMQRMAWIFSRERDYTLKGFDPMLEDYVVEQWVSQMHNKKLYIPEKQNITTLKPE